MTKILFLYDNLVDIAALTESSEATGFPVENLQHLFRKKIWRTEGGVAGTADAIFDFGIAKEITSVALIDYSWISAPGTFDLEFSVALPFAAVGADTQALTWVVNPTVNGNKATIVKTFTLLANYQYARLNVVYAPAAVPTDWDLGRMFLGTHFEPAINYSTKGNTQDIVDLSYIGDTIGGQEHVDEIEMYREKDFSFFVETQAQWELYQKLYNHIGKHKDLFIAFDYDNEPDEMTWYGKFSRILKMKGVPGRYFRLECSFKESR